jgi:uncharacterized protein
MGRARTIKTPHGPASLKLDEPDGAPTALLVLGHGAGGDTDAPDLMGVRRAALAAGVAVARVTQPYRVAGRKSPAPAAQLDAAWAAVVAHLRKSYGQPLVVGGRSSGARVACRTADRVGAAGIVCLAFPLHPPGRPERSRADELETGLPTLVVNGSADPFGVPEEGTDRAVVVVPGERHDLRKDPGTIGDVVVGWLREHGWADRTPEG